MHRRMIAAVVTALMIGGTGQLSGQAQEPGIPTLAGKWQLDPTRSDRPSRMDRGGLPGRGRPGGGRPGSFPGRPGGIPGEGGSPVILQLLRPSQQLEVTLSDSAISILDGAGFRRVLRSDGREIIDTLFGGQIRRTKVKRKEREFVLEQVIDGDTRLREKYRLDERQGDLIFDLKLESKRIPIPVEIRRMYLRVSS